MEINERIGLLLPVLGISEKQFAEKMNISIEEFSDILSGKKPVPGKKLKCISGIYGINTEWLKRGTGDIFREKRLRNGKRSLVNSFAVVEEEFRYRGSGNDLMKSLMILDIIREGDPVSIKEALDVLDDAKDILLEYKFI